MLLKNRSNEFFVPLFHKEIWKFKIRSHLGILWSMLEFLSFSALFGTSSSCPENPQKQDLKNKNSRQTKNMSFFWGEISNSSVSWVPFRLDCVAFRNFGYRFLEQQLPLQKHPSNQPWHCSPKRSYPLPHFHTTEIPPDFPVPPASLPGFVPWRLRLLRVITRHEGDSEPRNLGNLPWPQLCWSNFVEERFFGFLGRIKKVLTLIVGCFLLFFFRKGKKKDFSVVTSVVTSLFFWGAKWSSGCSFNYTGVFVMRFRHFRIL